MSANEGDPVLPTGKQFPLNSRRLSLTKLRDVAELLELPTQASADEIRQMIEGELFTMGYEPSNVQVIVEEQTQIKRHTYLIDENGTIREGEKVYRDCGEELSKIIQELTKQLELTEEMLEKERATNSRHSRLYGELPQLQDDEDTSNPNELNTLRTELEEKSKKIKTLWQINCQQLADFDKLMAEKEREVIRLTGRLQEKELEPRNRDKKWHSGFDFNSEAHEDAIVIPEARILSQSSTIRKRKGQAPPIDHFSGEQTEMRLDDWLPSLERAARWNQWTQEEYLIQLAGHLKGKALQEWNLITRCNKLTTNEAVSALKERLEPKTRVLAAQDFRHSVQTEGEAVSDYIRRVERTFIIAYGQDIMSRETREMLLHGQLQEGLSYHIMKAPAVSGAPTYQELVMAAKNEEKRLIELRKRLDYNKKTNPDLKGNIYVQKPNLSSNFSSGNYVQKQIPSSNSPSGNYRKFDRTEGPRCYGCGKYGHIEKNCRTIKKTESKGPASGEARLNRRVQTGQDDPDNQPLLDLLFSSSSSSDSEISDIRIVGVSDHGSHTVCAKVEVAGVPVFGIVDSGADITILGGELFRKIASQSRLKKKQLKKVDKVARNYDHGTISLDGRMDLNISFNDKELNTPIYIKMDATEQLLLSEGVCRQLGIITYHPEVQKWRGKGTLPINKARVPMVRVRLAQSVRILPLQSTFAKIECENGYNGKALFIESHQNEAATLGVQTEEGLFQPNFEGKGEIMLTNLSGFTQTLQKGVNIGCISEALVVAPEKQQSSKSDPKVRIVTTEDTTRTSTRKELLIKILPRGSIDIPDKEYYRLLTFLKKHHNAFSLKELEHGKTDLIQMKIDTGNTRPIRQPVRRLPFATRQEVARQLRKMQEMGIVKPSCSPWASPIVLVKKKDGTLRFCIDYRKLNAVTKTDSFPLPRIDDLLDQLGESRYFSTLDLASGYWQIPMDSASQEKTAFATHRGLYEFGVMPFGLCNAPATFQRLMQRVLMGLNPEEGTAFVSVYLDDILVFSRTLDDHFKQLDLVISRLQTVGLKLKPSKCHFMRNEVIYLGHVITPRGLQPNPERLEAIKRYVPPRNLKELRQFLGLASYYRRFIANFATIAHSLHNLTKKDQKFIWTEDCQLAFNRLITELTQAPVLAYPQFTKSFVLETDASIKGLGAVLSQKQDDGKIHPVAYASRALSPSEKNYAITELETLAVVWGISHYQAYLYGQDVLIYTDHTAVKAILENPSKNGKHARWWTKIYGNGLARIDIQYRPGKENANADALSRAPHLENKACILSVRETGHTDENPLEQNISNLFQVTPRSSGMDDSLGVHQKKDPDIVEILRFIQEGKLPDKNDTRKKLVLQAPLYTVIEGILYYIDARRNCRRVVVPKHLRTQIMNENHSVRMAGHFSGDRLYRTLVRKWWWEGMYSDVFNFCRNCPQCAIVSGGSRIHKPLLEPIPVQRPFQILGVDIMELPITKQGNKYVLVFQDFLTKWPMVFPLKDQKTIHIVRLLVEEIVPLFGVPEALLSDRGANLLSHLMLDVCNLLGIKKLNTTAYHPQCDGMVERFNRTLKTMLRKHADLFGNQWDRHLSGILWAYRNTPHESTREKPSFLLFGVDCKSPTEAAFLPVESQNKTDIADYRQELMISLSSARALAAENNQKAQQNYKRQYDKKANPVNYRIGQWVLVRFPHEETGKLRKLSRPWHGPYRIVGLENPDVTVVKIYFPQQTPIQIHQNRISMCPQGFPNGFYWYGGDQRSTSDIPKWILNWNVDPQISRKETCRYPLRNRSEGLNVR